MTAPAGPRAERTLADTTSPGVGRGATVLVPVGSLEQHGPHLPLDTDTTVAVAVAEGLAAALADAGTQVLVAPAVAYGSSGEHQAFPGTVSVGADVLARTVVELVRSLSTWAGRLVLVNGHGGNAVPLDAAVRQLVDEGHDVAWVPCAVAGADAHAGRTETSLMLHLRPDAVRLDRAVAGATEPVGELLPRLRAGGVAAVSETGVLGDPAGAGAAEGAALLAAMVEGALARLGVVREGV